MADTEIKFETCKTNMILNTSITFTMSLNIIVALFLISNHTKIYQNKVNYKGEIIIEKRFSMNIRWAIADLEKDLKTQEIIREQFILSSKGDEDFEAKLEKIDKFIESTKKRIIDLTAKLPKNKEAK